MTENKLSCFKAYDIRGKLGTELDETIARRLGQAFGEYTKATRVVVGSDSRLSSKPLKIALAEGLMDVGVDVIDLGLTGTEEIYFAAFHLDVDGGIEVTASHNPIDHNGMKMVLRGARPISSDSGLYEIQKIAETQQFSFAQRRGSFSSQSILDDYVAHLLSYIDLTKIIPLKIVVNAGNGAAGHVIEKLESLFLNLSVPIEFIKLHFEADGTFPNGIPNPLLPENRTTTSNAVIEHQADIGIAWDGDFDRCFFFDQSGGFIEGYYIVGLLAESFLRSCPGERIVHDPRLTWNTIDIVKRHAGIPIQSKTGHAFIKERMRKVNAIYGGEMSAHHYFRDFAYCDSGMIPWLLIVELLSKCRSQFSTLVRERQAAFPCSGEINYCVTDSVAALNRVENLLGPQAMAIDHTDGVSLEFSDYRLNLRASNTEPLLRLNVESRGNPKLVSKVVFDVEKILRTIT